MSTIAEKYIFVSPKFLVFRRVTIHLGVISPRHSKCAAIVRNNLEPGGTWASWGLFWRCDKVTLGRAHSWNQWETEPPIVASELHYWEPSKICQSNICQVKICQPPNPNAIGPILSSHSSSSLQQEVNSSSNPPSSPFSLHGLDQVGVVKQPLHFCGNRITIF